MKLWILQNSARLGVAVTWAMILVSCSTLPERKVEKFKFPKNAYLNDTRRPYTVLGPVRSKVDYTSLDDAHEENQLCNNYFNKAVRDLIKYAKIQGGDAVIDVSSVVFLEDGRRETYKTPECSDDGGEGQILTQGIAVKWKDDGAESGTWDSIRQPPEKAAESPQVKRVPMDGANPVARDPKLATQTSDLDKRVFPAQETQGSPIPAESFAEEAPAAAGDSQKLDESGAPSDPAPPVVAAPVPFRMAEAPARGPSQVVESPKSKPSRARKREPQPEPQEDGPSFKSREERPPPRQSPANFADPRGIHLR